MMLTWSAALFSLLKPRIVALLLFVSLAASLVASKGNPAAAPIALLLITGAMAAGGAGALNNCLERDLDGRMARTRRRPLVSGRIGQRWPALALGVALIVLSTAITLPANPWQALFLLLGAFVYIVVYTLWLKRRSRWNIVVGGISGSCAALAGWAAVGEWWSAHSLLTALLVFLWTPPHFWSLAITYAEDYREAGVPMLPVVAGPASAARWGLFHVVLAIGASVAIAWSGSFGWLYLAVALAAGLAFGATAVLLAWRPNRRFASLHFRISIVYLAAVFAAMALNVYAT